MTSEKINQIFFIQATMGVENIRETHRGGVFHIRQLDERDCNLWSTCDYFSASWAVDMAERLLGVPSRDNGFLFR